MILSLHRGTIDPCADGADHSFPQDVMNSAPGGEGPLPPSGSSKDIVADVVVRSAKLPDIMSFHLGVASKLLLSPCVMT